MAKLSDDRVHEILAKFVTLAPNVATDLCKDLIEARADIIKANERYDALAGMNDALMAMNTELQIANTDLSEMLTRLVTKMREVHAALVAIDPEVLKAKIQELLAQFPCSQCGEPQWICDRNRAEVQDHNQQGGASGDDEKGYIS